MTTSAAEPAEPAEPAMLARARAAVAPDRSPMPRGSGHADGSLARLLQLASPTLPVGGFSYSQGLEAAIESGQVHDAVSAGRWIGDVLAGPVGVCEAGFLARFYAAWQGSEAAALVRLDRCFQASRDGAELLAETRQMGWSMWRLAQGLPPGAAGPDWPAIAPMLEQVCVDHAPSYPLVWSAFAVGARVPLSDALMAWLWTWLENQVMVALKAVPLGQSAGQALLFALGARLEPLAEAASASAALAMPDPAAQAIQDLSDPLPASGRQSGRALTAGWADPADADDDGPGNYAPGFALASAQHETQYSRLFRS
jgi:urease accessory protein